MESPLKCTFINSGDFYFAYGFLSTNGTPGTFPVGNIHGGGADVSKRRDFPRNTSPTAPTLIILAAEAPALPTFLLFMQSFTNGAWSIVVTNATPEA